VTLDRPAVLIVGPSWVGDMVMAQSLAMLLARRRPELAIDMLAPAWSLPVIARMPEIRKGIVLDAAHGELGFNKRRHLAAWLRPSGYEQAIVLPRSWKAALVPWLAGIPRRTGYRGELRYLLINDRRPFDPAVLDQTVKRFVALGLEPGEPVADVPRPRLHIDKEQQVGTVERLGLDAGRPVIAMMPGAEYGPAKCWPLEYYRELAALLAGRGYAVWVFGSAKEADVGAAIAAGGSATNLCGRTTLDEAIDLLGACEQAVSNDSGLMHVAAAVGTRVVALYGSSSPAFTPPLTDRAVVHYLALDCSPCFERRCPLGHYDCLKKIRPADVLASIDAGA